MAIDSTGDTPHLYVADPYNNRVLGFKDARKLTPGSPADIVIGQPDMHTALCNYPSGDLNQPGQSNLCGPIGLLVDSSGNLYVADSGNGRVLRFPTPFAQQSSSLQPADRVVGQAGFYSKVTDPSPATMAAPYGLALSGVNGLLVSDVQLNRVLYFPMANGDLTSPQGEAATVVFGQTDFNVVGKPTVIDDTVMTAPRHVAADSSGRLYVADTGNNRVMIFGDPHDVNTASKGAHALLTITTGLSAPRGIFVSPLTGEIWVADTGNGRSLRYPSFEQYFVTNTYNFSISGYYSAPLALAQDQYGDLMVADACNRVEFYYPGLAWQNAASYVTNYARAGSARHHLPARRHIRHEYRQLQPTAQPRALPNASGRHAGAVQWPAGAAAPCLAGTDQLHDPHERAHQRHGGRAGGAAIHRPDSDRRAGGHEHGFSGHLRRRLGQLLAGRRKVPSGGRGERCGRDCERSQQPGRGWFVHFHLRHRTGLCAGRPAGRRHSAIGAGTDFGIAQGLYQRLLRGRCGLHRGNRRRERPVFRTLAAVSGSLANQRAHSQEHGAGSAGSPLHS